MRKNLLILPFLSILMYCESSSASTPIIGTWLTQKTERNAQIKIFPCANDTAKLCGKIVWLQQPTYPAGDPDEGKEKYDRNNPDENLRVRKLMGLQMLSNFERESDTHYKDGTIYNPEEGKEYSCTITLAKDDSGREALEIYGFVKFLAFPIGKTQRWIRVPDGSQSAGQAADTASNDNSNSDTAEAE